MTYEKTIEKQLRYAAQELNGMLLRNNSGVAREYDERSGIRYVRYGLGNISETINRRFKSSDLIGIIPVTVRPEHIGRTFGIFTAVEIKSPSFKFKIGNSRLMAQANFLGAINTLGGLGIFATKVEDFKREFRRKLVISNN